MRVVIEPGAGADREELDQATHSLRRELLELDVIRADAPRGAPPPPDARGLEAAVVGTLLITATRDVVESVIRTVAGWLGRRGTGRIVLEIDGDTIEITNPSADEQRRLVEAYLARHCAGTR